MPKGKSKKEKRSGSMTMGEEGVGNLSYGYSSMQGRRKNMEDAHTAEYIDGGGMSDSAFFAVYDGHGGPGAARFCAQELWPKLVDKVQSAMAENITELSAAGVPATAAPVEKAVHAAFKEVDAAMARSHSMYVTDDDQFGDPGTTATTLLVNKDQLVFSNLGDSRALLCSGGKEAYITTDHKPTDETELKRIEEAGGWVVSGRVCRMMAVARALGDHTFKENPDLRPEEQMLSPVPDVVVLPRSAEDEFALLACDGVFDVMSNTEVIRHIQKKLVENISLSEVCNSLTQQCYKKGSQDNITAVLVLFPGAKRSPDSDTVFNEKGEFMFVPRASVSSRTPSWIRRTFVPANPAKDELAPVFDGVLMDGSAGGGIKKHRESDGTTSALDALASLEMAAAEELTVRAAPIVTIDEEAAPPPPHPEAPTRTTASPPAAAAAKEEFVVRPGALRNARTPSTRLRAGERDPDWMQAGKHLTSDWQSTTQERRSFFEKLELTYQDDCVKETQAEHVRRSVRARAASCVMAMDHLLDAVDGDGGGGGSSDGNGDTAAAMDSMDMMELDSLSNALLAVELGRRYSVHSKK